MPQVAVLVVSCDNYSDLWGPFFHLFRRHWPDCPYPVFLGTNHKTFDFDGVTSIPIGEDKTWAENLHLMLAAVGYSRIILLLEDFLMVRDVNTVVVRNLVELSQEHDVGCLRLFPYPPPTKKLRDFPGLGEIQRGDDWRVSAQAAIWDVELLRALAWPGLSAWQFEGIGSLVSDTMDGKFWGVYEPPIDYCNAVVLGKWMPEGLQVCREAGLEVDLQARGAVSEAELLAQSQQRSRSLKESIRELLPYSVQRSVMRWFRLRWREFYLDQMLKDAGLQRPHER
jgi:hypothetical protein